MASDRRPHFVTLFPLPLSFSGRCVIHDFCNRCVCMFAFASRRSSIIFLYVRGHMLHIGFGLAEYCHTTESVINMNEPSAWWWWWHTPQSPVPGTLGVCWSRAFSVYTTTLSGGMDDNQCYLYFACQPFDAWRILKKIDTLAGAKRIHHAYFEGVAVVTVSREDPCERHLLNSC